MTLITIISPGDQLQAVERWFDDNYPQGWRYIIAGLNLTESAARRKYRELFCYALSDCNYLVSYGVSVEMTDQDKVAMALRWNVETFSDYAR